MQYSGTEVAHRAFVGTKANAGAVALVRTSRTAFVSGLPGSPFDNHRSGGGPSDCSDSDTCAIFPTVGTTSVLKTGVFTTLRLDDPQANQTLQCDPDYAQGQEFSAFRYGCKPWYGANPFTNGTWWNTSTKQCPDGGQWFSYGTMPAPFGKNSSTNPWRCVLTAPGMLDRTDRRRHRRGDRELQQHQQQLVPAVRLQLRRQLRRQDRHPDGWVDQGGDSRYPRVVNLFIVPYQARKGLTGAGDTIPVLGFASFYVMDWTAQQQTRATRAPTRRGAT